MAHLLCMRKNPTLGLNILHEACEGTDLWLVSESYFLIDQPIKSFYMNEPMRDPFKVKLISKNLSMTMETLYYTGWDIFTPPWLAVLPSHGTRVDNLINYRSLDDDVIDLWHCANPKNIKNDPVEALANPKEAKCTDGLKLMETVQFLCHRNLDFKAKNNQGKSFLDLVTGKGTSGLCRLIM